MSHPNIKQVRTRCSDSIEALGLDLLIVVADEGQLSQGRIIAPELAELDTKLQGVLADLVSVGDFEGKWLQTSVSLTRTPAVARRVMLLGAGKKIDLLPARARHLGVVSGEESQKLKASKVGVCGSSQHCTKGSLLSQLALGFRAGVYKYPSLNPSDEVKVQLETPVDLTIVGRGAEASFDLHEVEVVGAATEVCRLFQDGPPNIVTPKYVAHEITTKATELGLKSTVWGAPKLREMGFNAMMAVASGSAQEPQFVVVEYSPQGATRTLALVGKGLTMDTGGYSLKPPGSQIGMKYDMSGAAVVLSSILAIAQLKLPIRVFAVAALCENMVDAHAYRVNDIIKTYSGKTIEILNTDAEGRVVLADALAYTARELKPDHIVEYSTLTGAMVVALGHIGAGVFSFPDEQIGRTICQASETTGERVWPMPTWEEVGEDIKGKLADINNIAATAGCAGSIAGAMFVKEFVENIPFAHVDIAGVANDNMAIGYPRKVSSGFGVQLSIELARLLAK